MVYVEPLSRSPTPSVRSNLESQAWRIYDEAKASGLASEADPNIQMKVHMENMSELTRKTYHLVQMFHTISEVPNID